MIKINKVWSEEDKFKTLNFNPGMNFIVGDGSVSDEGRNGSGKSLSIELINFALLKNSNFSRISKEVPDSILPPNSFVYLNMTIGDRDVTIARNKKGDVLMKIDNGAYEEMSDVTAKNELANLCELNREISFRDLCNFLVKESSYSYYVFLNFFTSNVIDRLKTSLYFFGFPLEMFIELRQRQDEYDAQYTVVNVTKKKIESKGLDVDKLRSLQSELKEKISDIKQGLSYDEISKNISEHSSKLRELEDRLSDLLREKGGINYQLSEIEDFLNHKDEDDIIKDDQLKVFFNRYIKGLGNFVQNDLEKLKEFRDEVYEFETEMLLEQKDGLMQSLEKIGDRMKVINESISKIRSIIGDGKNHLQKGLEMSHELLNDFNDNGKLLDILDDYRQSLSEINANFQNTYSKLEIAYFSLMDKEDSFRKTFLDVHEKIYDNKSAIFSFDLSEKRNIKDKEFFKIKAKANRQGSEGINRVRQIIYDLSLIINPLTSKRSHNLLVHDRLLFGDIDHKTTFNILNYINSLNTDSFQYIATYNSDVMTVEMANEKLDFDIKSKVALSLTVQDPLFYKQFKQVLDYEEVED
jgi:chaperonin cofactor prefoldin